jgi:alkanesulfonate monooxygenase
MNLLWFIPTFGDGRYLGSVSGSRGTNSAYLRQIAEAVDTLGYYGALLPGGKVEEEGVRIRESGVRSSELGCG